jgi:hypothetical protein
MDNEDAILKAFNTFDLNDTGVLNVEDLRTALTTLGDKLTDKEVQLPYCTSRSCELHLWPKLWSSTPLTSLLLE